MIQEPLAYAVMQKNRLSRGPVFREKEDAETFLESQREFVGDIDEIVPLYAASLREREAKGVTDAMVDRAIWSHEGTTSMPIKGWGDKQRERMRAALESVWPNVPDNDASVAAIQFALKSDDGMDFLRHWNEGNFNACRREWPEAPSECYIGADCLFRATNKPVE